MRQGSQEGSRPACENNLAPNSDELIQRLGWLSIEMMTVTDAYGDAKIVEAAKSLAILIGFAIAARMVVSKDIKLPQCHQRMRSLQRRRRNATSGRRRSH